MKDIFYNIASCTPSFILSKWRNVIGKRTIKPEIGSGSIAYTLFPVDISTEQENQETKDLRTVKVAIGDGAIIQE